MKTWDIIKKILTWTVVVLAVGMVVFTIISVKTLDQNDRSIFGYKFFIVQSDSMSKTDFSAGDIIVSLDVKKIDVNELKEGDIITFLSQNSVSFGETVTHKIREVKKTGNSISFVTYGTTTDSNDESEVSADYLIGQYKFSIPKLGKFFVFLKTTPGYIVCILLPFLLLIIFQGINVYKNFKAYRAEQVSELQKERAALEEERAKSAEMIARLEEMEKRMAASGDNPSDGSSSDI